MTQFMQLSNALTSAGVEVEGQLTIEDISKVIIEIDRSNNTLYYLTFDFNCAFLKALNQTNWEISKDYPNTLETRFENGKGVPINNQYYFKTVNIRQQC